MSSYTLKEEKILEDAYTLSPDITTVRKLCVLVNKPQKSIIAKLVKMGLYITKGYVDKRGDTPITKLELVRLIEDATDTEYPGLDKAPKTTLKALCTNIVGTTTLLQDVCEELSSIKELDNIRAEMKKGRTRRPYR